MNRGWQGVAGFFGLWVVLTALLVQPVRGVVESLAPGMFPFGRIFGRVQLGVALGLVPLLLWYWRVSPKMFFVGSVWRRQVWRAFLWGGVGVGMVAAVVGIQVGLGVRSWAGWPGVGVWAGAMGAGLLVAGLEEFFFRGVWGMAWWQAMKRKPVGLLLASNALVFAAAHFLRPGAGLETGWTAGFLAWARLDLWSGSADLWKLAGLVAAGFILARMVWDQGNLAGAIGLHAGWVMGVKWAEEGWREVAQATPGWWGPNLDSGPLPFLFLLLLALAWGGRPFRAHLG